MKARLERGTSIYTEDGRRGTIVDFLPGSRVVIQSRDTTEQDEVPEDELHLDTRPDLEYHPGDLGTDA